MVQVSFHLNRFGCDVSLPVKSLVPVATASRCIGGSIRCSVAAESVWLQG